MANEAKPEGKRLLLLRSNLRKTMDDILAGVSVDQWKEALSTCPSVQRKAHRLQATFNSEAIKAFQDELNEIIEENDLDKLLKKRDELISEEEHRKGTLAWRPNRSVERTMIDHDMAKLDETILALSLKLEQKEQALKDVYDQLQEDNTYLVEFNRKLCEFLARVPDRMALLEEIGKTHDKINLSME